MGQTTTQPTELTPSQDERWREVKFTVNIRAYGTTPAARATVDKIQRELEVYLQRPIKITGRRYG